jgi:CRP-like cAMP-binding protein
MVTVEILKGNELFQDMTDEEIKVFLPFCKEKTFDAGTTLCTYGARGKEFYLLLEGDVSLQVPSEKEFGVLVLFVRPGSAFGISGLISPFSYTSTAKCNTKTKTIAIECVPFRDFIYQNREIGFLVVRNLARVLMKRLDIARRNLSYLVSQVPIDFS